MTDCLVLLCMRSARQRETCASSAKDMQRLRKEMRQVSVNELQSLNEGKEKFGERVKETSDAVREEAGVGM